MMKSDSNTGQDSNTGPGIGMRAHNYPVRNDLAALVSTLAADKIPYIQFAPSISFAKRTDGGERINPGFGNYIKRALAQVDISIAVLSCYVNIIHPVSEERERLLARFERCLKYAHAFGAEIVATETGSVDDTFHYTEANFSDAVFAETLVSLKRLAAAAEKHGVLIGIEPGLNHPIYSLERTAQMLAEVASPNLNIILDPRNLVNVDTYTEEVSLMNRAIELFGERIVAIHIKDFVVSGDKLVVTTAGHGVAPIVDLLEIAESKLPDGYVLLDEVPQDRARESYSYLSACMAGIRKKKNDRK